MNDSTSLAQAFKFYEHVRVMDDMNNYRSLELRPLDAMKSLGVLIIWMILSRVAMAPNALKQLMGVVDMNDFWSWAQSSRCYE